MVVYDPCAAHGLFLTTEEKLWSRGCNEQVQLGHGDTKKAEAPKLMEVRSKEVMVSAGCGRNHTLTLTETGCVFTIGENKMGQLGLGRQQCHSEPCTVNEQQPTKQENDLWR